MVEDALAYIAQLQNDWDGEGAVAPSEQSIQNARALAYCLQGKVPPTQVAPDGDGAVLFIWNTAGNRTSLTIDERSIHISIEFENGAVEFPESVSCDSGRIPEQALQYIPTAA